MKLLCTLVAVLGLVFSPLVGAQDHKALVDQANAAMRSKDYARALESYQAAFLLKPGLPMDCYNAACSAARLGKPVLAFALLDRSFPAGEAWELTLDQLRQNPAFETLRAHENWPSFVATVEKRQTEYETGPFAALRAKLLAIHQEDQKHRLQLPEVEKQHGFDSPQLRDLWQTISKADEANLTEVKAILDEHGWLSPKQVGTKANSTLFLVIQHSNLATQQKYLPMMRSAVQQGNAQASSLALLEDRVALAEGRPQTYGSQIMRDSATGKYHVRPLLDPDKVDERRSSVGLGPLADYVKRWDIVWDVEAYKAKLPELTAQLRPPR